MSPRAWTDRIQDILDAISEAQAFTEGLQFHEFERDLKTQRAVELNFIIIGEAAAHIPDSVMATNSDVPWRIMKAMRNQLVHAYFAIDPQIVWETARDDLPQLVEPLTRLLSSEEESSV